MDAGTLRGLFTLFMFLAFIGIVLWAYSARRKSDFEAAANLPLEDEQRTGSGTDAEAKIPQGKENR